MSRFLVVHTDADIHPLGEAQRDALSQVGADLVLFRSTPDQFAAAAQDADAILNADFELTDKLIASLRRCRVIARLGTGVDNIAVEAATARGIAVANVPEFCTEEVANRAWTLLLACAAQLLRQDRSVRDGRWRALDGAYALQIEGRTLGLVGFGKIARAVARRAGAFGVHVVAYDPLVMPQAFEAEGVKPVDLDTLLRAADFISLHVPLTRETVHLLDEKRLSLMKPTAILINTARGALIDEFALEVRLREGRLAGAGLDVLEGEPPEPENPLLASDRVILTPHTAAMTVAAYERVRKAAVDAVVQVLRGERPLHLVNPEVMERRKGK